MESSLAYDEINMRQNHYIDVVPHLLHGINQMHLYADFNIVQTFVQIPASEKNSRKNFVGQGYRVVDYQIQLCDRYNYPYSTEYKVGGPRV